MTDKSDAGAPSRVWLPIVLLGLLVPIALIVITQAEERGWLAPAPVAATDFDVPRLDRPGERLTLAQMKGRPLLINFWASWCAQCKSELPHFLTLASQLEGGEGAIISIATADAADAATAVITAKPRPFPVAFDEGSLVAERYVVGAVPHTLLIDRQGNIVKRLARPLTANDLPAIIAHLR